MVQNSLEAASNDPGQREPGTLHVYVTTHFRGDDCRGGDHDPGCCLHHEDHGCGCTCGVEVDG